MKTTSFPANFRSGIRLRLIFWRATSKLAENITFPLGCRHRPGCEDSFGVGGSVADALIWRSRRIWQKDSGFRRWWLYGFAFTPLGLKLGIELMWLRIPVEGLTHVHTHTWTYGGKWCISFSFLFFFKGGKWNHILSLWFCGVGYHLHISEKRV